MEFDSGLPPRVIVIGAGAAGLACAQQLRQWGYEVVVVEARDRIGGRCNTVTSLSAPVDLGASLITGLIGNPLDDLVNQLNINKVFFGALSCCSFCCG